MIENFNHRYNDGVEESLNIGRISSEGNLTEEEKSFLSKIKVMWNFYEGYHWEDIPDLDTPQVTFNYCRPFINKFVAFELGKGFSIKTPVELDDIPVTVNDPKLEVTVDEDADEVIEPKEVEDNNTIIRITQKTVNDFLNQVWKNNNRDELITEFGQTKSITGESWLKVQFLSPEDLDDPFEEYPNGKISISLVPTQYCFPKFDPHNKDKMVSLLIMYPIPKEDTTTILSKRGSDNYVMYKEFWTKDRIEVYNNGRLVDEMDNPYGFIPFVQAKNFPVAGRDRGEGDIEDIIPLNIELNTKKSDISEIIDYHSAPITLVYGAKIGNLEKGANKVWGGLPKDSRVENLALQGDLNASTNYTKDIKTSMCEIAGIPENVLGGASAISNTSGVALQYMNLPLVERTRVKRLCTKTALETVNKFILFIALHEGLIQKPEIISMKDFLANEVELPDTLPKDELIELSKIQQEFSMGLECRHGALERLGVSNIPKKMAEIDEERVKYPEVFNPALQQMWYQNNFQSPLNAGGMMNGQTPNEQMRIAMTGQNGGAEPQ